MKEQHPTRQHSPATDNAPPPVTPAAQQERRDLPIPRIYVASLTDYNAGLLHGRWIYADLSTETLHEATQEMLAESPTAEQYGEQAEEWAIHDHEGFYSLRIGEYQSFAEISRIAQGIAAHGEAFAAFAENLGSLEEEQLAEFEERYLGEHQTLIGFGEHLLEEMGIDLDQLFARSPRPGARQVERPGDQTAAIPEAIRPYVQIDVAGWVRDMELGAEIFTAPSESGGVHVFDNL